MKESRLKGKKLADPFAATGTGHKAIIITHPMSIITSDGGAP
jgi:hypothetical protein